MPNPRMSNADPEFALEASLVLIHLYSHTASYVSNNSKLHQFEEFEVNCGCR